MFPKKQHISIPYSLKRRREDCGDSCVSDSGCLTITIIISEAQTRTNVRTRSHRVRAFFK